MTRIRRLMPSPAMAVALLALFMAMGGSAYALVVTSGSIKNNTIRSVDVRNGGLLGKDFRKNGVGGGAIKESSLGTVPGAFVAHGSARFAVVNAGGQGVRGRGTTSERAEFRPPQARLSRAESPASPRAAGAGAGPEPRPAPPPEGTRGMAVGPSGEVSSRRMSCRSASPAAHAEPSQGSEME